MAGANRKANRSHSDFAQARTVRCSVVVVNEKIDERKYVERRSLTIGFTQQTAPRKSICHRNYSGAADFRISQARAVVRNAGIDRASRDSRSAVQGLVYRRAKAERTDEL